MMLIMNTFKLSYALLIVAIIVSLSDCGEQQKLNVTIYIESECPYSTIFIENQLKPNYEEFKDKINVKYSTFALAKVHETDDGDIEFDCLHGSAECEIDMFQACALEVHKNNQTLQTEVIYCTMDTDHDYKDCISDLKLNAAEIESCTNGNLGKRLARAQQQEFRSVGSILRGVPSIVFNDEVDYEETKNARRNFRDALMRKLNTANSNSNDEETD